MNVFEGCQVEKLLLKYLMKVVVKYYSLSQATSYFSKLLAYYCFLG